MTLESVCELQKKKILYQWKWAGLWVRGSPWLYSKFSGQANAAPETAQPRHHGCWETRLAAHDGRQAALLGHGSTAHIFPKLQVDQSQYPTADVAVPPFPSAVQEEPCGISRHVITTTLLRGPRDFGRGSSTTAAAIHGRMCRSYCTKCASRAPVPLKKFGFLLMHAHKKLYPRNWNNLKKKQGLEGEIKDDISY